MPDDPDDVDFESQDLSSLAEQRTTDLVLFGVRFRLSEPETYQEEQALFDPVEDLDTWVRRTLGILVDRPNPLRPVLDELSPWSAFLLAAEALTWADADSHLDHREDLRRIRDGTLG